MNLNLYCVVFWYLFSGTIARLEPTKIEHNGIYKLEIQSEDKWLTGVENANGTTIAIRSGWRNRPEQKWKFEKTTDFASGKDGWTIAPINNIGGLKTIWQVKYVGHGKFQFLSFANGMCLRGPGSSIVVEARCEKDDPGQRWLILPTTE